MGTVLAYVLTVLLVHCWLLIAGLPGFIVAVLLAWAPMQIRIAISGLCAGMGGMIVGVSIGYGIFRLVEGPHSFTLAPFIVTTIPLLLATIRHVRRARRVARASEPLIEMAGESGSDTLASTVKEMQRHHGSTVLGEVLGLLLAIGWFISTW